MLTYKAALIGLGKVAWQLGQDECSGSSLSHAAAYALNDKTELVAGYDVDAAQLRDFERDTGVTGYSDLQQLLSEHQPDVVSICSPTVCHAEHLEACFKHRVPMIWVEKPPAVTEKQVRQLETNRLEVSQSSTVLVNYQRRYTDSYIQLRQLMAEGYFGKTVAIDIKYSRGLETNGSHMLDIMFFLLGEEPYELVWLENTRYEENPDFVLQFDSGLLVHVSGIEAAYHNLDITVTSEKGRLAILHGGMSLRVEEQQEHELFPGYYRLAEVAPTVLGQGGFDHAFDKALLDLINARETGSQPASNLLSACQSQCLLEAIQQRLSN